MAEIIEMPNSLRSGDNFTGHEVLICLDCGSETTTILTFGIYCRACRSLRHYQNKKSQVTVKEKF